MAINTSLLKGMYFHGKWTQTPLLLLSNYANFQFSSVAQSCPTLCDPMNLREAWGAPSPTPRVHSNSRPSSRWCHLILCCPLFLLSPIPPSIRVFSNESTLHMRWPKYWSFNFSIIPSKEHPGLMSFRMDWLDLLAVQGTLKSLLHHHSSKASILRRSAFFTVQLSNPYMTTGKAIALTRRTFVGKVMSLLFNMLLRLVITFLPRSLVTHLIFLSFSVTKLDPIGLSPNQTAHPPVCSICLFVEKL